MTPFALNLTRIQMKAFRLTMEQPGENYSND